MATIETFQRSDLKKSNQLFSQLRTTIETAFYGSNMREVRDIGDAYQMAKESPGVIITDLPVKETKKLGLPTDAKVLVENGGKIVGRTARARRIVGDNKEEDERILGLIRDVIYQNRTKTYYKTMGYVGLDEDFIVKAHIAFPEGNEITSIPGC